MDICTLMLAGALLSVCVPPDALNCEVSDGKTWCEPQPLCKTQDPAFDCIRRDGTHYMEPWTAHPAFTHSLAR
jgi:hypothetical protein